MATEAKSTNYWISSTALYIQLNAMGEPDYIQCSVVSGASILCYMSDVPGLGYDAGHNYQRWPLVAYPSIFPDSEKKYIYAAIPRVRKGDNDIATVVFPSQRIDIYGKVINEQTKEGGSKELVTGAQIGNENFYYIYLQGIISEVKTDADGQTRIREWEQHVDCGSLATDEALASGGEGSWWKLNSVSDTISFLKTILQANFEELTAKDAKIIKLGLNGKDLTGVADETTLENSNTTVVTPQYLGQFGVKHFLAKDKDDTAKGTITFEKVQRFLKGLLVGNSNSENGGSWGIDAEGRSHLITDYLEVRMKAIFETLEILHTDTSGGELFITPVGSNRILKVEEVNITYDGVSQKAYRCYFLGEQDGSKVENKWKVGDQARSKSFNLTQGKYHNVGNHYYWRLVIGVSTETVEIDGKKYHYVDLSDIDKDAASDEPMVDDILNQCGNRTDNARQSCLVFSAVDTYSPSVTLYHGVNGYTFNNKEYVDYGVNHSTGKAFFHVYGDMYFGDRPTSANNYEGDSYVKYDSDKKKVTIKGDLDIKSTYDGKTLDKYIADKAAEKAQAEIKDTQDNLIALGTTVSNNKKAFDAFTSDGYLDSSEIAAIAQDSKRLEDDYNAAVESYNNVVGSKFLLDKDGNETTYKTDLVSAKSTLDSAKNELITYLSDIVSRYNASDSDGKATIKAAAAQKYTNFTNAYKAFYDKLGVANNYITSNLFDGLNTELITNMAGLEYIKTALVNGKDTEVKGGLILSTLIALRNDKGNVTAGINGADTKENGIALWLGGKAIDRQASTTKEDEMDSAAKALLRFDGTGYFANGNLWWDADGTLHADPTSFIINKNNVGVQLALFAPVWKSGTTDTTKLANVLSIDPQKPFTHLDVSGNVTTEGSLKIGGIYLSYDSANNALRLSKDAAGKEAANFYATGGITAYGAGASTTGGGGLNASVISYARILEGSYTDADLTSIPNAYAIKALSSRIDNIATELGGLNLSWNNITGKPSTFTPSAHTHKWADITDRITKVSQLTNDAGYLTTHQSLASYYTKTEIDAKGYTTNKGTVTSVSLTLPTGLTCATKTITTSGTFAITLASGYSIPTTAKQTAWDGAVSAKHTHSNKSVLDGISSTKVSHWDSAYDWYALMTTDEETADGIINKWNEVVSFLANIAQTDTLSGIVDGINKSISDEVTRAKKAEGVNASGISTNKTSITTLQGYFTSGSAKKALQLTNARKLWGNSFNGTADINGSIIVPSGKYISIGNIKMEYDATNKALKITNTTTDEVANLYTSGGVSAYGVGTSSSSGGGLNGSVKSYADALKLTSESLSEIASAYSIKALDSRISSLEGGSATAISVSGSGNAVTSVTKNGTTISVVKGATFLTSHQSLAAYLTKSEASSTYQPKGNYLTSHQSLSNYYTKNEVNSIANGKSDVGHTHQYITDGSMTTITGWNNEVNFGGSNDSSTIYFSYRAQGNKPIITDFIFGSSTGTATVQAAKFKINGGTSSQFLKADGSIDNNTYLTSHQSLTNYYTKDETDSKLSGYLPLSGGTMLANARITHGAGNLYIGNPANDNWLAVQDICSQNSIGDGIWSIRVDGTAHFQSIKFPSNRLIAQVSNGSNSPLKGIKLPSLVSDAIGIFSKTGNGSDEGGIVLSEDTCVIYNSFDSGWGLSVRDKDLNQTDISSDDTVAFGIRQTYKLYSRGGFEKKGSSDEYVLLGGGGHSKITELSVSNADTVDGYHATSVDNKPWGTIPVINTGGWMDIGKQLEFHYDNTTNSDYSTVLRCTGNYSNDVHLPSASGTLALTSDNVASATKLKTARTIWGQSFDGTADIPISVSAKMPFLYFKRYDNNENAGYVGCGSSSSNNIYIESYVKSNIILGLSNSNIGIGTNNPGYKLHVAGDIYSSDRVIANNSVLSNKLYSSTNPDTNTPNKCIEIAGNTISEYHSEANSSPYHSAIRLYDTSISLSAYGDIDISAYQGSLNLSSNGGFTITYRGAKFSVDQTGGAEFTWTMDSIKANGNILATGGITAYSSSDLRLKQDLRKLDYLGIIKAMGGTFGFAWKKDNTRSIGWIAQHVLLNPHLKDIVETDENGYYKINYWSPKLIATAFGAIEQVDDEVTRLKKKVKTLENRVKELEIK